MKKTIGKMVAFYYNKFFYIIIFITTLLLLFTLFFDSKYDPDLPIFYTAKSPNEFSIQNINISLAVKLFEFSKNKCETISRTDFINSIDKNLNSLEIGPFHSPCLLDKNVKYFDVFTKKELIEKAKILNIDSSRVPVIDYVSPSADLKIINEKFDVVFSSHNIEHQVDLIQHLNDVYELLNQNGRYYLFIPTKYYIFDHYIPETLLSDVLSAHSFPNNRHTLKTMLTQCETTHNEVKLHWENDHGTNLYSYKRLPCYKDRVNAYFKKNEYVDAHQWRLHPENFVFILNSLYMMGLVKFRIDKLYCTMVNSHEFEVVLIK
jgi:SAM-dependent methyltransferase